MGASFHVVFCSSDSDSESFNEYYASMPWSAIPFGDSRIQKLKDAAGIQGIPTLIFVDTSTGKILHEGEDGTDYVYEGRLEQVLDWTLSGGLTLV